MNKLSNYLQKYYELQDSIMLVYRENNTKGWGQRAMYLGEGYNPLVPYNHRSVLDKEIVIEYDTEDIEQNRIYADIVMKRMRADGFKVAKWSSGNKSTHVHILVNSKSASNIPLLKRVIVRYYCKGLPIPDLQLVGTSHLIRAEYGVHEKTGKCKELIFKDKEYPCLSEVPKHIWPLYIEEQRRVANRRLTMDTKEFLALPGIQLLLKTEEFRKYNDGRKRSLLLLIFVLKEKYTEQELIEYLWSWYTYNKGSDLTKEKLAHQVHYYIKKNYSLKFWNNYLNDLLSDIGREDLIKQDRTPL